MTRKQLEEDAVEALLQCTENKTEFRDPCRQMVLEYHDETLQRIIVTAATEHGFKLLHLIAYDRSEDRLINDWMVLSSLSHPQQNMSNIKTVADALPYYKKLSPQRYGHYPKRRTAQVTAIFRVTDHLYTSDTVKLQNDEEGNRIAVIANEQLSDLIISYKNPGAVADLIIKRGITDPEQLTEILCVHEVSYPDHR